MPGKNSFTSLGESLMAMGGQDNFRGEGNSSSRIIYPAVVRNIDDFASQNRIKAEIVSIGENGRIFPGKDKDTPVEKLPICIPLMPEYFHLRPQVGECVWVIAENPSDLASPRFWIGPVITQQPKLQYQSYEDSISIFELATFGRPNVVNNPSIQKSIKASTIFPQQTEVAVQGRDDADITFSPREINIRVGKFKKNTIEENVDAPCRIQLKMFDSSPISTGIRTIDALAVSQFKPFSQQNFISTNINIFSPEGKFRKIEANDPEFNNNPRLKDFGEIAQTLHPAVFGDELIKLLSLMLNYLANHIHTPQNPALPNPTSQELEPYRSGNKLQDLVSNVIRIN
jgi:hypothetical protein